MKQYKTNLGTTITIYDDNNVFDSSKGYIGKIDNYGTFHAADGSSSYELHGDIIASNNMMNVGTVSGKEIMINSTEEIAQEAIKNSVGSDFESAIELFKKFILAPVNLICTIMFIFAIVFLVCKEMGVDLLDVINNSSFFDTIGFWIDKYSILLPIIFAFILFVGYVIKTLIRKIKQKRKQNNK